MNRYLTEKHYKKSNKCLRLSDFPPKLAEKCKKPQNRQFLLSVLQIGGWLEPHGVNIVGMDLKVAGGNFDQTVKISGQLNLWLF